MNLSELIETHRAGRTYADLARDAGGAPSGERFRQLLNQPMKNFPDPPSVKGLAKALKVPRTVVILAAAQSLGLDVDRPGARLVELLPAKANRLSEIQAAAVAHLVDVMVNDEPDEASLAIGQRLADEADSLGMTAERYEQEFGFDYHRARDARIVEVGPDIQMYLAQAEQDVARAALLALADRSADAFTVKLLLDVQRILGVPEARTHLSAARVTDEKPHLRIARQAQDEAGEAPDPEGPEGGA